MNTIRAPGSNIRALSASSAALEDVDSSSLAGASRLTDVPGRIATPSGTAL